MTSEVGRNHRQKKQQKKNTHIHQDKETRRDDGRKLDYEGKKKRGQWGNKTADRRISVHNMRQAFLS